MNKAALGSVTEMNSNEFVSFIHELESFSGSIGLDPEIRYCRRWEYPWIWLNGIDKVDCPILDIGSALSPFPWYMASKGRYVTMTELTTEFAPNWARIPIRNHVDWRICPDEQLPFPSESFGAVTSVSVIEHQPNKPLAFSEIIRVLAPGGILAMSFDVFEKSMGMVYPRQDIPMTLESFESMLWFNPAFGNTSSPNWNLVDVPEFLAWHSSTHEHHTFVAGAAILTKI